MRAAGPQAADTGSLGLFVTPSFTGGAEGQRVAGLAGMSPWWRRAMLICSEEVTGWMGWRWKTARWEGPSLAAICSRATRLTNILCAVVQLYSQDKWIARRGKGASREHSRRSGIDTWAWWAVDRDRTRSNRTLTANGSRFAA